MSEEDGNKQPIVIKKIKKGGGHHGGAWKVAYADFVTAMMAFFLLLWLLNISNKAELQNLASFFDPSHPKASRSVSGAGGVMGGLSMSTDGAMISDERPIAPPPTSNTSPLNAATAMTSADSILEKAKDILREEENERLEKAQEELEKAIESDEDLKALKDQFIVDMTPEGLRIQVIDKEGNPMFATGSASMFDKTKKLLERVGQVILGQPNELSIRGHTDSVGYGPGQSYTNWELSADRANSSRRVLLESGFPAERINNVVGKAATDPLLPDDTTSPANRRISIILLKEELTNPDFAKKAAERASTDTNRSPAPASTAKPKPRPGTFKKTPGAVEFP